jgi:hypothetical protein
MKEGNLALDTVSAQGIGRKWSERRLNSKQHIASVKLKISVVLHETTREAENLELHMPQCRDVETVVWEVISIFLTP